MSAKIVPLTPKKKKRTANSGNWKSIKPTESSKEKERFYLNAESTQSGSSVLNYCRDRETSKYSRSS